MKELNAHAAVGQLVAERPGRSRVFERWGLDYCCGGKKTLDSACEQKGVSLQAVLDDIRIADDGPTERDGTDWTRASLTDLVDHIVSRHHVYLRQELPRLSRLIDKVVQAHGGSHAELWEVASVFASLSEELNVHTMKEELILFPFCRQLDQAIEQPAFHCGSIQSPIAVMEMDHNEAGMALSRLRDLTHGFAAPEGACNTYRAMLDGLAELEADLHEHIHKENNILFPRAIAREAALLARRAA